MCEITSTIMPAEQAEQTAGLPHHTVSDFTVERHARTKCSAEEEDSFVPVVDVFTLQALTLRPHNAMIRVAEWCAAQREEHRPELPPYHTQQQQQVQVLPPSYDASMTAIAGAASFTTVPPLLYNALPTASQPHDRVSAAVQTEPADGQAQCVTASSTTNDNGMNGSADDLVAVVAKDSGDNKNQHIKSDKEGQASLLVVVAEEQDKVHTGPTVAAVEALHVRVDTEVETEKDDSTTQRLPQTRKPRKSARPVRRKNEEGGGSASAAAQLQTLHARLMLSVDSQRRTSHAASPHRAEGHSDTYDTVEHNAHSNINQDERSNNNKTNGEAMTEPKSAPLHACYYHEHVEPTPTSTNQAYPYSYDAVGVNNSPAYAASGEVSHTMPENATTITGRQERPLAMSALSLPHSYSSAVAEDTVSAGVNSTKKRATLLHPMKESQVCISNGSGLCAQSLHTQQQQEQQQSSNDTRDTMSTTPLGLVATFSDFRARVLHRWPANTSVQTKYNHQEGNTTADNGLLDIASNRNDTTHVPAPFSHASMQGSHGLTGVGPTFAEVEALYSGTQSRTSGAVNSRRGSITSSHTLHAPPSRPQSPSYSEQTSLRPMSTTTETESGTGRSNGVALIVVSVGEKDHPLSRPMSYGAGNHASSTSASMPMYYYQQQQNNVALGNAHGNGIMRGRGNGNGVVVNFPTTMRNGSGPANVGTATTKANTILNDLRVSQPWVLVATDWLGGKEENNEEEEAEAEQRETTLPSINNYNDAPFTRRGEASDADLPEAQKDDLTQTHKLLQKHVHQLLTSQLYELLQGWNLLTSHVTATHITCEVNNNNNSDDNVKDSVAVSNPNEVDVRVGNNVSSNALHSRVLSTSAAPFVPMTIDNTTSDTPAQSTRPSPRMMSMTSTATTLTAMPCDTTQPHTSNEAQTTAATLHERAMNGNTNNLNHCSNNEENIEGTQMPLCAYRSMGVYPYGLAYAVTRAGTAHASFPSASSSSTADEPVECNGKTPVMQAESQHNNNGNTDNTAHLPSHDSALHVTQPYFSPLMTPSATAVASPDAITANGAPTALNTNTIISGTRTHANNTIESNHKMDGEEQIEYFRAKACIQVHITPSPTMTAQEEDVNVADEKTRFFARAARLARDLQQFTSTGHMSRAALKAQLNDALMALLTRTPCFATCLRPSHNNNDVDDLDEAAECMTSCATSSVSLRAVRWPGGRLMSSALLTRAAQPWRVKVSGPFPCPSQSTTHNSTSQPHRTINNSIANVSQPPSYITPLALHLTTHVLPGAHNDTGNNEEEAQDVRLCVTVLARRTLQGSAHDKKSEEEVQPVAMREAAFAALTTLFPAAFILSAHTTQIAFSHCVVHDGMVHMQPFQSLPLPVVRHVQPHIVKDKYAATSVKVHEETKTERTSVQVRTTQQVVEPQVSVTSQDTVNAALTLAKSTVQDESEQSAQPVSVEVTHNTSASPACTITTTTTVAVPKEAVEEPMRATQSVTMWAESVSDEVHKAIEAWLRLLTQWSTLQTTLKDATTTQLLAQLMQEGSNVTTQSNTGKRRSTGGNARSTTVQSGIVTEVLEGYVQLVRDELLTLIHNVSDEQKAGTIDSTNEACDAIATTLAKCATMPELTRWLQQHLVQPVQALEDSLRQAHALQEIPLTIATSMGSTTNSAKHSRRGSVVGAQLAVGKGTSKSNATGSGTRTGDKIGAKSSAGDVTLSVSALPALRVLLRIVQQLTAKDKARKRETTSAAVLSWSAEAVETLWQEAMREAAKYNIDLSPSKASTLTHARDALVLRVQSITALLERRAEQLRLLHAIVWPQCLLPFVQEHARLVQDCMRCYDALRVQYDRNKGVLLARTEQTVVQGSTKGTRQSDKRKGSTATTTTTTMSAGEDTEVKDAEAKVSHSVEQQTKTTTPTNNNNKGTTSRTTSIGGETQATTSNTPRAETHSTELELTQHSMLLMMSSSTITTNTAATAPAVTPEVTEAGTSITNISSSRIQGGLKEKTGRTSLPVTETHSRSSTTTSCIVPTGTPHVNSPRKTPDESSTTTDTITAHHKKTASVATTATISSRSGAEAAAAVVVVKKPLTLRGSTHQSTNSAERRGAAYHASSLSSSSMTNITNSSNRRTRNEGKSDEPSAPASRTNNNTQSNSGSANRSVPRRAQDSKSPSSIRKSDNTVVSASSVVKSGVSMPRLGEHRFVMQDRAMAKISIIFVLCGACILVALFYL